MAGRYGFIAQIGGNVSPLRNALREVDAASRNTANELREINRALRMDPNNVTLVSQRMTVLREAAEQTRQRLALLRAEQDTMARAVGAGMLSAEGYREYQREIAICEAQLSQLNSQQREVTRANIAGVLKGVGAAAAACASALAAVGKAMGEVAQTGKSFDTAMSTVAATMAISTTSEDYEKLTAAAKKMGAETKYSATEAAEALNYLALAGYDTDKAIEALPGMLGLAQAGAMDLAGTSDMVTDTMSALGLASADAAENQKNLTELSDKMAVTAQKSNTSVSQLGEALLTVGGTAKSLSGGLTETTTLLGLLADNGVKGSEGGTALRNVILSLTAPTDTAKKKIEELGIVVSKENGDMLPMVDILKDLNNAMNGLGEAQKVEILNEIFNKVDLKSVNALLGTSSERFEELSGYIDNSAGAAQKMADTMADNLEGALTSVSSAFEGFELDLYSKFSLPMKNSANLLAEVIRGMTGEVDGEELKKSALALGEEFAKMLRSTADIIGEESEELIEPLLDGINGNMVKISEAGGDILLELVEGLVLSLPYVVDGAFKLVEGLVNSVKNALPELLPSAVSAAIDIVCKAIDDIDPLLDAVMQITVGVAEALPGTLGAITEKIPTLLGSVLNAFINTIENGSVDFVQVALETGNAIAEGLVNYDWATAAENTLNNMCNALDSAQKNTQVFLDNLLSGGELYGGDVNNVRSTSGWFLSADTMRKGIDETVDVVEKGSQWVKDIYDDGMAMIKGAAEPPDMGNAWLEAEKKREADARAVLEREKERAEEWKKAQAETSEAGSDPYGWENGVVRQSEMLEEALNELEHRYKVHNVTEAEYWAEKKALLEKYRIEDSEEWHGYYDDVISYYDKLAETEAKEREEELKELTDSAKDRFNVFYSQLEKEEITRDEFNSRYLDLAEECAEKQVDISEYAADKIAEYDGKIREDNLKAWESNAKDISDSITKAYSDVTKAYETARDGYIKSAELVKERITDNTGKERYILDDFKAQTKALRQYQSDLAKLKESGIGEGLLNQIMGLSYDSGERQGVISEILNMNSRQRAKYYSDAEKYYAEADNAATADTADKLKEADRIAKEGIEKIYGDMPKESYIKGTDTAKSYLQGIIDVMGGTDPLRRMGADIGSAAAASSVSGNGGTTQVYSGNMKIVIEIDGKQQIFTLNELAQRNIMTGGNSANV